MRNAYLQQCDYGSRFRILKGGKISLVVSALIASTTLLHANPSGGVVMSGSASIASNGSVTTITQSTQKAAINWQNFSIATNETVNFKQPNVSSVTLNRVVGNEKSIIDGALNANGQVFLLNSNGVLFSKNASINTAGFVATTMNLSDTDFMNGNYTFEGESQASIINQGTINISDKGYAALFGKEVANEGIIKATLGKVHLTGASEVTLNLNGNSLVNLTVNKGVLDALVENKGAIYADGGDIYLTTNAVNELLRGVVNNTGIIEANSIDDITGKIELYAHGGALHVSGTLKAKEGFIETSGKTLHVSDEASIKAKEWLIDPDDITITDGGADGIDGSSIDAGTIISVLNQDSNVILTANNSITVNEDIIWSRATQLTLTAGTSIYVNATIDSTSNTNGGVYFNATDKVLFSTAGKVIVNNAYQLQWINTALQGKYELGGNINAVGTYSWEGGSGFVPIGNDSSNAFSGSFDGKGYTIDGLIIKRSGIDNVGLFGYAGTGAIIQNIGLTHIDITGKDYVGGLVGVNNGDITNAYTTGRVSGTNTVGGLVGEVNNGSITNAYTTGHVSGTNNVGRLVGWNNGGAITNVYATDIMTEANNDIGGLVGCNDGTITASFWNTDISVSGVGSGSSSGMTGKTTAQLQLFSTFDSAGWDVGVGTTAIPSLSMGGTYIWTMLPETVSYSLSNVSDIYQGTAYILSSLWDTNSLFGASHSSWVLGTDYTFLDTNNAVVTSYTNAGTYSNLHVNILRNGYTQVGSINTAGTLTITPALLTVTATNASKTYDGLAYSGGNGVSYSGFVNSETASVLSGTLSYTGTSQGAKDAGSYVIAPSGLSSSGNYTLSYADGILTIDKRPVSINVAKIYDGNADFTTGFTLDNIVSGETVSIDSGSATVSSANTGSYTSFTANTLNLSDTNNYTLAGGTINAIINPSDLTAAEIAAAEAAIEAARIAAEQEAARLAAETAEVARLAAEQEAARIANRNAAIEAARIAAEQEAARLAAETAEAARLAAEQEAARIANRNAAIEAANARIRAQQEAIKRAAIEAERAAKAEAARIAAEAANAARLAAIEAARLAAEAAEAARLAAEQEAARIANRNAAIEAANARIRAQQEAIKRAAKEEANRLAAEAANAARLAARHSNTETQTMDSATQSPMGGSISSVATQSNTPIAQFSNNGQTYDVFLQPVAGVATQEISLQQLSSLMGIQGSSDVKIPLLQGVSLNFTQGGINLPAGINQQFYIAQQ